MDKWEDIWQAVLVRGTKTIRDAASRVCESRIVWRRNDTGTLTVHASASSCLVVYFDRLFCTVSGPLICALIYML